MSSEIQVLATFVKEALLHSTREEVKRVLLEVGWSPEQAAGAINAFADVNFPTGILV